MINPQAKKEKRMVLVFLLAFFFLTLALAFFSTGTYESGDSIQHFLISKYAFKHPILFLDHWGKPFFTLISSPFSQLGFIGINIFNILCATASGYIAYLIAYKLNLKFSWLAPLFALMAPIYYVTLISGLTEPLFGLILLLSIYLFISEKYFWGAFVVSLLPFVRSEGFILLLLFAITLMLKRAYKYIPVLGAGTLIYSLAGQVAINNFFWIIQHNPYKDASHIYGSGSFFHFIHNNEFILGTPLVVLFLIGSISLFSKSRLAYSSLLFILPFCSFMIYFLFHSVLWWKGAFGSLGLIRVMAGVTPLAGLIALKGIEQVQLIFQKNIKKKKFFDVFLTLLIITIFIMPFKYHGFPRKLSYEEVVVKEAADWILKNNLRPNKQYYMYPYYSVFLSIDPFDSSQSGSIHELNSNTSIGKGAVVAWDNHFSPNEGGVPLSKLQNDSLFELLAQYKADPNKTPKDKQVFELYLFRKK